jgi:hypothetical protein
MSPTRWLLYLVYIIAGTIDASFDYSPYQSYRRLSYPNHVDMSFGKVHLNSTFIA